MLDIHRSPTSLFGRRAGHAPASRPRHHHRRWRLSVEALEDRALLSTLWTVDSLGDAGTGSGQSGDLRYVITQADQATGDNIINFSVTGTIWLKSALPELNNTTGFTDIEGPGAESLSVARNSASGTPDFRILTVDRGADVKLVALTVTGGSVSGDDGGGIWNDGTLTISNTVIDKNSAVVLINNGGGGGGIWNGSGTLTVTNSTIDNNSVDGPGYGGGIWNGGGTLTVTNSTIDNNSGDWHFSRGGGIWNGGGTLTVTSSSVSGNSAAFEGGGIDNGGTLTVSNTTIDYNSADAFGGIYNSGTTTATGCSIMGNSASGYFGKAPYPGIGGGLGNEGMMTIANCTISDNLTTAPDSIIGARGGGIYNTAALTVSNSTIDSNSAIDSIVGASYGGGFYNSGTLTVTNSTVVANSAMSGGGIDNHGTTTISDSTITGNSVHGFFPGYGGGIYTNGTLTVTNSTIVGNSATSNGGGIDNDGTLTVTNSTISENSASTLGGGIGNDGTLTIITSTIAGNSASSSGGNASGGGIYNSGTLTVIDSTIGGNRASSSYYAWNDYGYYDYGNGYGGGIGNDGTLTVINSSLAYNAACADNPFGYGIGGGIDNNGTVTVTNSTIAYNSTDGVGGGVYGGGTVTVTNSTIAYNIGFGGGILNVGTLTLNNTIVALNSDDIGTYGSGSVSGAYNLIGTGGNSGLVDGVDGNKVGVADPGLDLNGLQNNGGPTQTIALVTGSPAIDAGRNDLALDSQGNPLTTDQRGAGFSRNANGTVDIGAYEVQSYITGAVSVGWSSQTAALQTASDGLRLLPLGRNTDMPWLGIQHLQIALSQAETLTASDISISSANGIDYGLITVTGSGTSYTITWANPIDTADRVTITIGNTLIASFTCRLDVLPGDVNDDGVVSAQDTVLVRNQMIGYLGAVPTIFGDINGDGVVDINDFTAVRKRLGTHF